MYGYIDVVEKEKRFLYVFEEGRLTAYKSDALPIDEKRPLFENEIKADYPFVVGSNITAENLLKNKIIFFIDKVPFSEEYGNLLISTNLKVYYYIVLNSNTESFQIEKLMFEFPELDYFFNLGDGYEAARDDEAYSLKTVPWEKTQQKFNFSIGGENVSSNITVSQTLKRSNTPLLLQSHLICEFKPTSDMRFIMKVYDVIKYLFGFLCHRHSININTVGLYGKNKDGKKMKIGDLHISSGLIKNNETDKVIQKTIGLRHVQRRLSQLAQQIADNKLYLENIPHTNADSLRVDAARVILNMAAFEWAFKQHYESLITENENQVRDDILEALHELPEKNNYNSEKKSEFKKYEKVILNVDSSLSKKIRHALNDCHPILSDFINQVKKWNEVENDSYPEMADRLQEQRNNFVHGNIGEEVDDRLSLDVIILERLTYGMVLKSAGYRDNEIFNIINHIFERNFSDKAIENPPEIADEK